MDITQISSHNGDINREVRLIYVIDRRSGMPIYFQYVVGNIIDVSALITTVSELGQHGVSVNHTILDAGCFSEKNAAELFKCGIPFMTRLALNKSVFKDAASGNLDDLMSQKYAYRYGERLVSIKKVKVNVCGHMRMYTSALMKTCTLCNIRRSFSMRLMTKRIPMKPMRPSNDWEPLPY